MHPNPKSLTLFRVLFDPQTSATSRGRFRWFTAGLAILLISACATTPPDPDLLNNAQAAIARANQAGAETLAPLELRLANRRLTMAQEQIDQGNIAGARHLADQAQIEAELAFARTRAARARADLETKRQAFEALQANLVELYGEEVLP